MSRRRNNNKSKRKYGNLIKPKFDEPDSIDQDILTPKDFNFKSFKVNNSSKGTDDSSSSNSN